MLQYFFECLVPISKCNLKCEYCYVIQQNRRDILTPKYEFSINDWKKAICKERIGKCFFSFCGYGETLLDEHLLNIAIETLKEGHIVNVTNNGTITKSIDKLLTIHSELQSRLLLSFSLHYDELKKRNMLQVFAKNVKKVMESDISCFVQINLCDSYINQTMEIAEFCTNNFGCLPQVALTRNERTLENRFEVYSKLEFQEYKHSGDFFKSRLFDFTCKNFNVKRNEYCYAGEKSYCLDLSNGDIRRCYSEPPFMNFILDADANLPALPIGVECNDCYCINSSHFLSLGVIEEIYKEVNYVELRNREVNWIKNDVAKELSLKLISQRKDRLYINLTNKNIYVYGAGNAAHEVLKHLKARGLVPQKIFVTKLLDGINEFEGIEIDEYDSNNSVKDDAIMIIAIKDYHSIELIKENVNAVMYDEIYTYYDILQSQLVQ